MTHQPEIVSEVAWLMRQITQEYEAAYRGLHGLSQGSAQHDVISARLQRMAEHHETLKSTIGEQQAIAFLVQVWNQEPASMENSSQCRQEQAL